MAETTAEVMTGVVTRATFDMSAAAYRIWALRAAETRRMPHERPALTPDAAGAHSPGTTRPKTSSTNAISAATVRTWFHAVHSER